MNINSLDPGAGDRWQGPETTTAQGLTSWHQKMKQESTVPTPLLQDQRPKSRAESKHLGLTPRPPRSPPEHTRFRSRLNKMVTLKTMKGIEGRGASREEAWAQLITHWEETMRWDRSVKSNQPSCGRIGDRQTGKPKGQAQRRNEKFLAYEIYKVRI